MVYVYGEDEQAFGYTEHVVLRVARLRVLGVGEILEREIAAQRRHSYRIQKKIERIENDVFFSQTKI